MRLLLSPTMITVESGLLCTGGGRGGFDWRGWWLAERENQQAKGFARRVFLDIKETMHWK